MEESTVDTLSSLWIFTYTRDKLKFSGPLSPLANGCTQPARQIHVLHINYSGPGGVTVRNKILSNGGFRRKKEGMSNILKTQLFLTICTENKLFV